MAKRKRRKKRAGKPPPKCKAILLCEQTLVDEETERVTASDIFNVLSLPGFPTNAPPFTVFVQLVDGIGRYKVEVQIQDLREDRVIATTPAVEVRFPQRLMIVMLIIPIPPLPLDHPGRYDVLVLANDQEIDRQQFIATNEDDDEEEDFEK